MLMERPIAVNTLRGTSLKCFSTLIRYICRPQKMKLLLIWRFFNAKIVIFNL